MTRQNIATQTMCQVGSQKAAGVQKILPMVKRGVDADKKM